MNPHKTKAKDAHPSSEGMNLYELVELKKRLEAAGGDSTMTRAGEASEFSAYLPGAGDSHLRDDLQALWNNPRGPWRRHVFGSHEVAIAIDQLSAKAPNLSAFFRDIGRSCALSIATGTALRIDPIILVGPPGIGKTWAVKGVGRILGTTSRFIAANTMSDLKSSLCGLSPFWSRARKGIVASTLLDSETTSPIIVLDEVDKVREVSSARSEGGFAIDFMHSLLEAENASSFEDEFLEIAFRADHIIWILTANDLDPIPPTILDRLTIVKVDAPDPEATRGLVRAMFDETVAEYGGAFDDRLPAVAVEALCDLNPRRIRRAIRRAFGIAAIAGRTCVTVEDVRTAVAELSEPGLGRRHPIGFLAPTGKRLRAAEH